MIKTILTFSLLNSPCYQDSGYQRDICQQMDLVGNGVYSMQIGCGGSSPDTWEVKKIRDRGPRHNDSEIDSIEDEINVLRGKLRRLNTRVKELEEIHNLKRCET